MYFFEENYMKELNEYDAIVHDVINSFELQRLKKISFLGLLNKIFPTKSYSRYDHSLGVGYLGLYLCRIKSIPKEKGLYLVLACLLHDIGHLPYSHLTERIFKIDHKKRTFDLIKKGGNGYYDVENSVNRILKRNNIDPDKIIKILKSESKIGFINSLFEIPINLDTIEAINRCAFSLGIKGLNPLQILKTFKIKKDKLVLNKDDFKLYDQFWFLKNRIYQDYIYSDENIKLEARYYFSLSNFFRNLSKSESLEKYALMHDEEFIATMFNSDLNHKMKIILENIFHEHKENIEELKVVKTPSFGRRTLKIFNDFIIQRLKDKYPDLEVFDQRILRKFKIESTMDFYIENSKNDWLFRRYIIEKYAVFICLLSESLERKKITFYIPEFKIPRMIKHKFSDIKEFFHDI